jgi:hypothetical protein
MAGPASAAPPPTVTTLTLSAPRIAFGHEDSELLTFQVASSNAQPPTGAVTITTGPFVICDSALTKNGTGTCTMPSEPGNVNACSDQSTHSLRTRTEAGDMCGTQAVQPPPHGRAESAIRAMVSQEPVTSGNQCPVGVRARVTAFRAAGGRKQNCPYRIQRGFRCPDDIPGWRHASREARIREGWLSPMCAFPASGQPPAVIFCGQGITRAAGRTPQQRLGM